MGTFAVLIHEDPAMETGPKIIFELATSHLSEALEGSRALLRGELLPGDKVEVRMLYESGVSRR
jgi:hypothetical protein